MSDIFIHEIFKIHHRKWPEIHVCLNFSFYDGYERICRIKNSSIKKSSRIIYSRLYFFQFTMSRISIVLKSDHQLILPMYEDIFSVKCHIESRLKRVRWRRCYRRTKLLAIIWSCITELEHLRCKTFPFSNWYVNEQRRKFFLLICHFAW